MSAFRKALRKHRHAERGRRWIFIPPDQLSDQIGPLSREPPRELGVVLVETPAKAARRPYHKQKLALVLANLRHFARAGWRCATSSPPTAMPPPSRRSPRS